MAITTLDGALGGMTPPSSFHKVGATMEAAGVLHSLFYTNGLPGPAVAPSGLNGTALTTYAGQIPFTNPGAGNSYLARVEAESTVAGTLWVCDRLWHNAVANTTGAQGITSPTWPARDRLGATNGLDVLIGLEFSTVSTSAGTAAATLAYTDEGGNAGSSTMSPVIPAAPNAGSFFIFPLAAGDLGVRSVTSFNNITAQTGAVEHLVAFRVLAKLGCMAPNIGQALDLLTLGFPRLYDNTVPFLIWQPTATTAATVTGHIVISQG